MTDAEIPRTWRAVLASACFVFLVDGEGGEEVLTILTIICVTITALMFTALNEVTISGNVGIALFCLLASFALAGVAGWLIGGRL